MHYHNITKDDMRNGDGLRVVLWVSGCEHTCAGCHNQFTWEAKSGIVFDEEAKQELFLELDKAYISGITLSGGDPLYHANREQIEELLKMVKEKYPQKNVWLYTGYLWEEVRKNVIMKYVDILIDGKYEETLADAQSKWRGSKNQRVIDVKKSIEKEKAVLYCE